MKMGEQADQSDGPGPIVTRVVKTIGLGVLELFNAERFAAFGAAVGGKVAEIVAAIGTRNVGVGEEESESGRHGWHDKEARQVRQGTRALAYRLAAKLFHRRLGSLCRGGGLGFGIP